MAADTNSPGIDTNGVFHDPWGSPYIVTLDLNYDNNNIASDYTLNQEWLMQNHIPPPSCSRPGHRLVSRSVENKSHQ